MTDHERELRALLASASRSRLSRRDMLRRMGAGAGALSLSAWLAACGVSGTNEDGGEDEGNGDDGRAGDGPLHALTHVRVSGVGAGHERLGC